MQGLFGASLSWGSVELVAVNETRKAIDYEDHGHRSKQTIVAMYLPDSPLHVVSILYANSQ